MYNQMMLSSIDDVADVAHSSHVPHLLDLDFDHSSDKPLRMLDSCRSAFLDIVEKDLNYLKSIGAMNYSLCIGIYSVAPPPPSATGTTLRTASTLVREKC